MRFFLAGIMQGSRHELTLHDQNYRSRLSELLKANFSNVEVYDPLADHADSVGYGDQDARSVFYHHNRMCREVDALIAFVPEATMGTAIEMWEAHEHGRAFVIAISPLEKNWAVKFSSHVIYPDMNAFELALATGEVAAKLNLHLQQQQGPEQ